jgi:anaerobic magnesium-protoporphyrin IX monomethyl ester cyclase
MLYESPLHPRFYRPQRSPAVIKSGTLYYPVWLSYATGVLENAGYEVKLIDVPAEGYDIEAVT